jgi:hypothetical protein
MVNEWQGAWLQQLDIFQVMRNQYFTSSAGINQNLLINNPGSQ